MADPKDYDEDYFLHGKESGKSLYSDYRWMPELTVPMAQKMIEHCAITKGARVLDFGCARGYLVKALRGLGIDAFGYDVSKWALDNADPEAKPYLTDKSSLSPYEYGEFDWIIAKDVLEHVQYVRRTIDALMSLAKCGLFAVVPLSEFPGSRYRIEEYEKDVTHCQRWPLWKWGEMFARPGWRVELAYRVQGIKDNYAHHAEGNGFITCRRLENK